MSKITFVLSWLFKLIGFIFTYMLIRQSIAMFTGDQTYLIFELFFVIAWLFGAIIFLVIGFVLGKIRKTNKENEEV